MRISPAYYRRARSSKSRRDDKAIAPLLVKLQILSLMTVAADRRHVNLHVRPQKRRLHEEIFS
jgi:hypothetical protein